MIPTPLDLAQRVYEREQCARTFPEDLVLHLRHGYVISTPTFFMMGRPVRREAPEHLILDTTHRFDDPDCWLVWLCVGASPAEAIAKMPYHLPYVGWQRHNRLRFYHSTLFSYHATAAK